MGIVGGIAVVALAGNLFFIKVTLFTRKSKKVALLNRVPPTLLSLNKMDRLRKNL